MEEFKFSYILTSMYLGLSKGHSLKKKFPVRNAEDVLGLIVISL